ncbi:MAG: hypothetical protein AAFZ18_31205, partial [Myxococcota bacterium]
MLESARNFEEDLDEVELLTQPGREQDLRVFLALLHPADVAELLARLPGDKAMTVVDLIGREQAAEAISELDHDDQGEEALLIVV